MSKVGQGNHVKIQGHVRKIFVDTLFALRYCYREASAYSKKLTLKVNFFLDILESAC